MILTAPLITVNNDDDSTATLMCLSSIIDVSVSFVYKWTEPDNPAISGETDGIILIIFTVGVDMCTSTASYTGSEVDSKYIIDSMNTASVYLAIIGRLFKCNATPIHNLLHMYILITHTNKLYTQQIRFKVIFYICLFVCMSVSLSYRY